MWKRSFFPISTPANIVDEPVRLAILPEHWTGWVGRPDLSGSRAGRAWSPKFTTTEVRVDGKPVIASGTQTAMINAGVASVAVDAADEVAQLKLHITIELTAGGLIRARAEVINIGADPYAVNDLVIAFPLPQNRARCSHPAARWSAGFYFAEGEIWAAHTGWSGNHPLCRTTFYRRAGDRRRGTAAAR